MGFGGFRGARFGVFRFRVWGFRGSRPLRSGDSVSLHAEDLAVGRQQRLLHSSQTF